MTGIPLTTDQRNFILTNAGRMKQKDIALAIEVTPACVCKVLKPKAKVIEMTGYFTHDKYYSL